MWLLEIFLLVTVIDTSVLSNTLCAFSKTDNVKYKREDTAMDDETYAQHSIAGHQVDPNSTEHCSKESDSCYALWQEDPVNKSIVIITQGCWDSSGGENCGSSDCIAYKKPPKALNNSKFCCCSGNLCNLNVSDGYVSPYADHSVNPGLEYVEPVPYAPATVVVISVAAMTVFVVIALVMYYLLRFYFHPPKRSKESLHLIESATPQTPMFDFDSLKIEETIGRGRYGTVCHGTLHDHAVAVKVFSHQNKQYFVNEREIYTLPHMEHPSLLKFIGSEERINSDGRPEYLLVLSYAPGGCLQDFLRNSTFDSIRLCRMSLSIARGLAHLHTEYGKNEKIKPCIAHRDLNSRNVLIKADGSCMLCDFGFAIRISGSKYYLNGEEQVAETTSLADVGTLRYMAPEILEGAVNLRDCESSLKQIDVYALGLVLWEIATRCTDLFQGVEVLEYKMPFEAEVGTHPTMEQMQVLVARHKARPLFPDIWKDKNPAVRILKETIEECWDSDAEARLTTLCVEERLAELPVVWERYKAGLNAPSYLSPANVNPTASHGDGECETLNNGEVVQAVMRERTRSLSEGTTETLLSPSEPGTKDVTPADGTCKNSIANSALVSSKVSLPLQPHQGRNPCLERNLMLEQVDTVAVSGNTLIERKVTNDTNFRSLSDGDVDILESPTLDSSSLVSNDILSHSTQICNKIPYHVNAVRSTSVVPKQPNVPGNGHSLGEHDGNKPREKHWSPLKIFDRKKTRTKESIRSGLKGLLERKSSKSNSKELCEEQQPLKGPSAGFSSSLPTESEYGQNNGVWTKEEERVGDHIIDTEVWVVKSDSSSTVVKPLSNTQNNPKLDGNPAEKVGETEALVKHYPNSIATDPDRDAVNVTLNEVKPVEKCKRPNSLPLNEFKNGGMDEVCEAVVQNTEEVIKSESQDKGKDSVVSRKNSNGKRKGVKRVKTPYEFKGRFSLYDDRIMSSQELSNVYSKETVPPILGKTTKFSTSVPLDMNALCLQHMNVHQQKQTRIVPGERVKNGLKINPKQLQVIESVCDI